VTQIAHKVNAAEQPEEVLELAVNLTCRTFGFYPVTVFGIDQNTGEAVAQACSVPELNPMVVATDRGLTLRLPIGQGIVGTAAADRRTVVANSVAEDERFLAILDAVPPELTPNTQAEIAIPLLVNGELLGVLDVQSPQVGAFGSTEQSVLEALAAEIATAIYKARQLAREQEQAWITTAQLQVAEAIGRHDDRDEMLAEVARLVPILAGATMCGFLLWHDDSESYYGATLIDAAGMRMSLCQDRTQGWGMGNAGCGPCGWPDHDDHPRTTVAAKIPAGLPETIPPAQRARQESGRHVRCAWLRRLMRRKRHNQTDCLKRSRAA
jgi:hypothetical protein